MYKMKMNPHIKRAALLLGASLLLGPAAYADADKNTKKKPAPAKADCAKAKAQTEDVTFLGVYTTKVPPALAQKLEFTKGFYLAIAQVEPGSPAADAGLKAKDILQQVDDQILINPEQLRELIRSKKPGHTVGLTYFRGGEEHTTSAKLETRTVPVANYFQPRPSGKPGSHAGKLEEQLRKRLRDRGLDLEQLQKQGNVRTFRAVPGGQGLDEEVRKQLREHGIDLNKLQQQGHVRTFKFGAPGDSQAGGIIVGRGEKPGARASATATVKVNSQLHFSINDDHGSLSLSMKDGKGDLEIKDKNGKTLYKGGYKPGQKLKDVPAHWQKRLQELDLQCETQAAPPKKNRKKSKKKEE